MASNDHQPTVEAYKSPTKSKPETTMINYFKTDLVLRILVFVMSLVAIVVMITSKQVKVVPFFGSTPAKFTYSSALVYFVVACSVTCLYSILSVFVSANSVKKTSPTAKLLLNLILLDSLMVGIMASATGAVSSIAYIGLHGNSHVHWIKVCNIYDKFCRHVGGSVVISLLASIVLLLLVNVSAYSLYHRTLN